MKKVNLIILLSLLTITFNCSKDAFKENSTNANKLSSNDLIRIHKLVKQKSNLKPQKSKQVKIANDNATLSRTNPNEEVLPQMLSLEEQYTDNVFETNYNYVLSNGLENLFIQYGLNSEIIDMADWAMENINLNNLYDELQTTFSIDNEQDAYILFYYIELYNELTSTIPL